ncbi:MAG: pilus assembly protein N-terminal domain-containing protein [Planctomycetota bacterium]
MIRTLFTGAVLGSTATLAGGQDTVPEPRMLVRGMYDQVVLDSDVTRFAVANPDVLSVEPIDSRELLVGGLEHGRTSLFVWLADGTTSSTLFVVEPDLSVLRTALADIDPNIQVESAPDRAVLVLTGTVPDINTRDAAVLTAEAYLAAGRTGTRGPLLAADEDGAEEVGVLEPGDVPSSSLRGRVVDLLRVTYLPDRLEDRIERSIAPYGGDEVTVTRVQVGLLPDDANDVFILDGSVPDQVTLTRMLFVASRTITGGVATNSFNSDIRVLADESGALTQVRNLFGAGAAGGGGAGQQQGLQTPGNSALGGGGGGQQSALLANRIGAQIGRSKVVEAANGRLLSLVDVEHLPLVRVDVRLYEVNTSRLRTWRSDVTAILSDFDQGALLPSGAADAVQGANAASVGQDDIQGVLGFLDGGLASQTQLVSGGFAVDALFQLLVQEEVARTLSNPSLTVLSGELAQFQVGGQVPIPVALTIGGGTDQVLNAVEFREFGIDLTVRPLVEEIESDRITLDVIPRVSLPDLALTEAIGAATGAPTAATAFESRATRTHTRVFDGDALLIGGLTTQRERDALGRTPWLGDVPGLGWLFRNEATESEETELVVVIMPVVLREARPEADLWVFPSTDEVLQACLDAVTPPPPPEEPAQVDPDTSDLPLQDPQQGPSGVPREDLQQESAGPASPASVD